MPRRHACATSVCVFRLAADSTQCNHFDTCSGVHIDNDAETLHSPSALGLRDTLLVRRTQESPINLIADLTENSVKLGRTTKTHLDERVRTVLSQRLSAVNCRHLKMRAPQPSGERNWGYAW